MLRKFSYDAAAYKREVEAKAQFESRVNLLKTTLATKSMFGFSELFIALLHLKVMRAFIDGVLRFGIPPKFYIGVVAPVKGQEKHVLASLNEKFDDKTLAGMYSSSTKEEVAAGDEDFYSFVAVPLTTPLGI